MNTFDLQIQSSVSDGKYPPAEIVRMAKARGLTTIALTDHDTIDGIAEAVAAGEALGLTIIPGVELTAVLEKTEIHILGLGINPNDPALLAKLDSLRQSRERSPEKLLERLERQGLLINAPDETIADAETSSPAGEKQDTNHRPVLRVTEAINLIHAAGGVAIWSHPARTLKSNHGAIERFLAAFTAAGLDGIEAFHPDYSEEDTNYLDELAKRENLIRTAGSDFHGDADPYRNPYRVGGLGEYRAFGRATDDILPKLEAAITARRHKA